MIKCFGKVGWLIFFCLCFNAHSAYNSYGVKGYINTPSAFNSEESTLAFSMLRSNPDRKLIILGSPFNWLDANIFYVDITGEPNNGLQSYKDKGFSAKFTFPEIYNHQIGVGLNDLAGTGIYSSEYIVISGYRNKMEYSFGMGWGGYSEGLKIRNPFISLSEKFLSRSSGPNFGGQFSVKEYFSGESAALFFGGRYFLNQKNRLIFEYDPTNRDQESNSRFNIGHEFIRDSLAIKTSLIKGTTVNLQLEYSFNYMAQNKDNYVAAKKATTHANLQKILKLNDIGLISVKDNSEYLLVDIKQTAFQNQHDANKIVYTSSELLAENKEYIIVAQYLNGMRINENIFQTDNPGNLLNYSEINSENIELDHRYQVVENFPIFRTRTVPVIRHFLASREGFYFGGILLENNSELFFGENIYILSNLKYSLYDAFDQLYLPPKDTYPNQVRSDIKKYLNNLSNGISIGRLEINFFKSLKKRHFFRFSGGILEEMFAGIGGEYQYYPQGSLISYGAEYFYVNKRDYSLDFKMLNYKNSLARVNASLYEPKTKIRAKISYGEYLAGDYGFTYELSRRFQNGIEFGIFFTLTDVTSEQFGEGSFDKGIKIKVPFSFTKIRDRGSNSLNTFEWHPLTKDPGARLIKSVDILDEIVRFRTY